VGSWRKWWWRAWAWIWWTFHFESQKQWSLITSWTCFCLSRKKNYNCPVANVFYYRSCTLQGLVLGDEEWIFWSSGT
jgi:hypothetical protein